jgi:uncharacterized protein YkwD
MRDLRGNRDDVPDFDRFGFRPLSNPTNFPQIEPRSHHSTHPSKPKPPSSSPSSSAAASSTPIAAASKHSAVSQRTDEFLREALQVHNELRRRHGVESLRLNNDLSKLAQQWGKSNFQISLQKNPNYYF